MTWLTQMCSFFQDLYLVLMVNICVLFRFVFPYRDCKMVECNAKGKDDAVAKKLWQVSAEMVGLEETI